MTKKRKEKKGEGTSSPLRAHCPHLPALSAGRDTLTELHAKARNLIEFCQMDASQVPATITFHTSNGGMLQRLIARGTNLIFSKVGRKKERREEMVLKKRRKKKKKRYRSASLPGQC